jgi:hypothetical protein
MTKPAPAAPRLKLPLRPADVRGLSRLGVDAVVGVTDLVEAMHHTIASISGITGKAPAGRPSGITGFVYRAVRGTTRTVGHGLDVLWGALPFDTATSTPEREAFVAALNGVWGDHLVDTGNPLAIPMSLRIGGRPYRHALANARPTGKLLVLVHGLTMNDLQWSRRGQSLDRARPTVVSTTVRRAARCTPISTTTGSTDLSTPSRRFCDGRTIGTVASRSVST